MTCGRSERAGVRHGRLISTNERRLRGRSVSLGSLCRLPTAVARFTHSSPLASRLVPTVGRPTVGRESRERRVGGGERGMTKGETDRYAPSHVHRPHSRLSSFASSLRSSPHFVHRE